MGRRGGERGRMDRGMVVGFPHGGRRWLGVGGLEQDGGDEDEDEWYYANVGMLVFPAVGREGRMGGSATR